MRKMKKRGKAREFNNFIDSEDFNDYKDWN